MRILIYLTLLFSAALVFAEQTAELKQARKHINAMEYSQAENSIKQHLAKHTGDIKALHLLAKAYAWDNNYKLASQTYERLLKSDSNNPEYLFGKGSALVWLQKNEQAIPFLDKAWNIKKNNPNYLRILILTLKQTSIDGHKKRAKDLSAVGQKKFPNLIWD